MVSYPPNKLLTLILFCCFVSAIKAQDHHFAEEIVRGNVDSVNKVTVFYPISGSSSYLLTDTSYSLYHTQYDPARKGTKVGGLNASYLGSEIFNTYYSPKFEIGFDVGHHAYDLYKFKIDTAALYKTNIAYTNLMYAQGGSQTQAQTAADFGTRFDNQFLSIGYKRVNNTGEFQQQESINTAIYLAYHLTKPSYDLSLMFGSNVIQDKYNGGITTDTLFGEGLAGALLNIPILLEAAEGRHQNRQYLGQWTYKFDWLKVFNRFKINSKWSDHYVKIFDTEPVDDYYGNYYIDERGLRQYIRWKKWENKVSLARSFTDNSTYEAGVQYNYVQLYQEPERTKFSEIYGFGSFNLNIAEALFLKTEGKFGLQNEILEWKLDGSIQWITDYFALSGRYQSASTLPDLIERKMILRKEVLYDIGQQPILFNAISGDIEIPFLRLNAKVALNNISNYRYWVQGALAPIISNLNLLQFKVDHHLQLGLFHMDNIIAWQLTDQEKLPVPEWQGRHQLYIETDLFNRNMHLKTGFEGRYYIGYTPPYYQPFYGTFFVGNETPFDSSPILLDYFLGFRVQTFYFFGRVENIQTVLGAPYFYSHYKQAYSIFGFRLGARWRLSG